MLRIGSTLIISFKVRTECWLKSNLNISIETNSRIEHHVDRKSVVSSAVGTLSLAVDVERQSAAIEVQLNADNTSGWNATVCALSVQASMHEPAASTVYIHAPASLVLSCNRQQSCFGSSWTIHRQLASSCGRRRLRSASITHSPRSSADTSPLSLLITPLFHSRLKTHLFLKSFPP